MNASIFRLGAVSDSSLGRVEKREENSVSTLDVFACGQVSNHRLESIQVNGTRFIGDHGGISWAHVKSMGMGMAKKAGKMEQAYPFRTQKSAFINCPGWIITLHNIFKKFLSKKVQDRIIMVAQGEDIERLFEAIPRENIPEKFGGKLKPIDQKAWLKDMEKKAPEIEKSFEYLKQLCNPAGSYTQIKDEPELDIAEFDRIREEALAGTGF